MANFGFQSGACEEPVPSACHFVHRAAGQGVSTVRIVKIAAQAEMHPDSARANNQGNFHAITLARHVVALQQEVTDIYGNRRGVRGH
jgi:homoserine kinase